MRMSECQMSVWGCEGEWGGVRDECGRVRGSVK